MPFNATPVKTPTGIYGMKQANPKVNKKINSQNSQKYSEKGQ